MTFQSSLKPLGLLVPILVWMFIECSSTNFIFFSNQKSSTEKRPRWCKKGCFLLSIFFLRWQFIFHQIWWFFSFLFLIYFSLCQHNFYDYYRFQDIRWSKWFQYQTCISDFLANQKPACIYKRYYILEYKVFHYVLCFISQQNILIIQRRTEIETEDRGGLFFLKRYILWKYFSSWVSIFMVWLRITISWICKFVDFVFVPK